MNLKSHRISQLGLAYSRYGDFPFGILDADRLMHIYVVGQTGTGKSTLLGNLTRQDAKRNIGFCLIDPHGDLATSLSQSLKVQHKYWDIADPANPLGYNPLTHVSPAYRPLIASGFIDTLKKQWSDAWGARMEHLLRYGLLALLETPKANIQDIMRLYTDKEFRRQVVHQVQDEQVRRFWTMEYPNMNYQNSIDGVASIANKLGSWLSHPTVRKAICDPVEPLRFRRIMDQNEILIVNLAKGRLGADLSNVIGGLLVSSIMNAAFSRHNIPESERRPFFLYIDEFHSFTTEAFASMMSESRKYGLGLILAHQHIVQTDSAVFESILGNVGSLMVFRVGANDAPLFSRQLGTISVPDLVNLPNYQAFTQLMVRGVKTKPFTVTTYPPDIT